MSLLPDVSGYRAGSVPDVSGDLVGSASNLSVASPSRILPRVEAGEVLTSWELFGSWKTRTALMLRFYCAMAPEGVVSPEYEDQAMIILTARLSRSIQRECREHDEHFHGLWLGLCDTHAKRADKIAGNQYSELMRIKMLMSESVEEYVSRADGYDEVLDFCSFQYNKVFATRAVIKGLHAHFRDLAGRMLCGADITSFEDLRVAFERMGITGKVPVMPREFGNATIQRQVPGGNRSADFDRHRCGEMGHISQLCPQSSSIHQGRGERAVRRARCGRNGNAGKRGVQGSVLVGDQNWVNCAPAAKDSVQHTDEKFAWTRQVISSHVKSRQVMNSLNKGIFNPGYKTLVHPKHMCNNEKMLTELVPYCVEADFGNDARVRIIYKGNIVVSTAWEPVDLTEVLTVLWCTRLCACRGQELGQLRSRGKGFSATHCRKSCMGTSSHEFTQQRYFLS